MYVMGVDAGGTKTRCMICDENEHIVGRGEAGASQHQMYGIAQTKENLTLAVERALTQAKLCLSDISYAVLGMSGADGEDDFALLIPAVGEVLSDVPYEVLHDSWIGLRAALGGAAEKSAADELVESTAAKDRTTDGTATEELTESEVAEGSAADEPADGCSAGNDKANGLIEGVVSICGTGAAHAGMNGRGERLTLRNLDYITGNSGGGAELCEKALHYAFRSEEGTYDKSLLEELIPPVFEVKNMEEVCGLIKNDGPNEKQRYGIPIVVFEAAKRGDAVAAKLLSDMGREEGRYAAAVIKRLGMTEKKVPVVLIGSLFQTGERLLIDAYMEQVHMAAPQAYPVILKEEPVLGAVRFALDKMSR